MHTFSLLFFNSYIVIHRLFTSNEWKDMFLLLVQLLGLLPSISPLHMKWTARVHAKAMLWDNIRASSQEQSKLSHPAGSPAAANGAGETWRQLKAVLQKNQTTPSSLQLSINCIYSNITITPKTAQNYWQLHSREKKHNCLSLPHIKVYWEKNTAAEILQFCHQ